MRNTTVFAFTGENTAFPNKGKIIQKKIITFSGVGKRDRNLLVVLFCSM